MLSQYSSARDRYRGMWAGPPPPDNILSNFSNFFKIFSNFFKILSNFLNIFSTPVVSLLFKVWCKKEIEQNAKAILININFRVLKTKIVACILLRHYVYPWVRLRFVLGFQWNLSFLISANRRSSERWYCMAGLFDFWFRACTQASNCLNTQVILTSGERKIRAGIKSCMTSTWTVTTNDQTAKSEKEIVLDVGKTSEVNYCTLINLWLSWWMFEVESSFDTWCLWAIVVDLSQ